MSYATFQFEERPVSASASGDTVSFRLGTDPQDPTVFISRNYVDMASPEAITEVFKDCTLELNRRGNVSIVFHGTIFGFVNNLKTSLDPDMPDIVEFELSRLKAYLSSLSVDQVSRVESNVPTAKEILAQRIAAKSKK